LSGRGEGRFGGPKMIEVEGIGAVLAFAYEPNKNDKKLREEGEIMSF